MKLKRQLAVLLLAVTIGGWGSGAALGAVLAQYTFNSSSLAATTTGANVSAGSITSGPGLTSISTVETGAGFGNPSPAFRVDKGDANTSSFNANNYISFTVTANSGYYLNLNGSTLTFDYRNGPTANKSVNWAVRSSVDGYANNLLTGSATGNTITAGTLNLGAAFSNLGSVEFRFYVWQASGGGDQDLYFDNIPLNGLAEVPEPVTLAFGLFALGGLAIKGGRMLRRGASEV